MSNEQETQLATTSLGQIKQYLGNDAIKQRFSDMLGKRSSAFTNSLINVVRNSEKLQNCTPDSIMAAAVIPATLDLCLEPTLGQAYIVPYKNTAVFQIGYKGVIQLCIRSGQYKVIHCSEIYADELKSHNPITGHVEFKDPSEYKMRYADKNGKNVIGHYAYFMLTSGFEKAEYMTVQEVMAHARKYSQAYQYDLKNGKKSSPWSTDPIPMGNKTVLLRLLKKFGIMSVEMRNAFIKDESFEEAAEATARQIDAEQGSKEVVTDFEPNGDPEQSEPEKEKPAKQKKKAAKKKAAKKSDKPRYYCGGDTRHEFDEPRMSGPEGSEIPICPTCLTSDIVDTQPPDFMNDN